MAVEDRSRIYNRQGICLCDPRVTVERDYAINDEGQANFDIAITDPNYREDYLRPGNWLLTENSKLQPWVGMIDTPIVPKRRFMQMQAYTPEHQFTKRNVPRQLNLSGKAGAIFKEIINITNREQPTIIQAGTVWMGGPSIDDEELSGDTLLDVLQTLVERTGGEYSFTPVTSNGQLQILANWRKTIGTVSQFPLEESWNVSDEVNQLRIQGDIENELWGYGNGADQNSRATAVYRDKESYAKYGLMQGSYVYSDYVQEGKVLAAIRQKINETRFPENLYKFAILDEGATYEQVRLGNVHPLRLWSPAFGVNTKARVVSMFYDPLRGKADVIGEEVFDDVTG
jgi:tail protein (putative endopeptidase)